MIKLIPVHGGEMRNSSFSHLQKSENNIHIIYLVEKTVKSTKTEKNTELNANVQFAILTQHDFTVKGSFLHAIEKISLQLACRFIVH